MQQGKDLLSNPARLINSSKPTQNTTHQSKRPAQGSPPMEERRSANDITPKQIADLFGIMIGLYGAKWTREHGLADRTGQWLDTLIDLHPNHLELGIRRVKREGNDWPPSAPEFRRFCQPKPEDMGLPEMAKAWQEANDHAGSPNHHPWSHRAVYLAGRTAGWHELRSAGSAQECRDVKVKFTNAYQALTNRVLKGEPLEDQLAIEHRFDPATYSSQLQRETMNDQGIDPLDGQGARAKLMGMF